VRDDHITGRQRDGVGNIALDEDIGGLRSKLRRVLITVHGENQVDGFILQTVEDRREDPGVRWKIVPKLAWTVGRSGSCMTQAGSPSSSD
jgi:hypothetical protein